MKKFLLLIFCMAAMLTSYAQPPASYDFEAPDVHGNALCYKITDATRNQVKMVQPKGSINGPLDIPAQVENGGVTYNVVGAVGFFSMGGTSSSITHLTFHEGLEEIGYTTFWGIYLGNSELIFPSTLTSYGGGAFYQTHWTAPSVTIRILNPIPAPGYNGCPAFDIKSGGGGGGMFVPHNLKLIVPTDVTRAYCNETTQCGAGGYSWSSYADFYREEVTIGASGYATLYLATENFKVPTGCDAFVIENITKATTPGGLDKANAKKFVAGSIIPAGQAVILKGAANQTCVYQANVSGTPVTITDNMLIGTATDQTINATGYDYYLFGNGALGQGFYRQTGHDKSSISLKAHKAGLRVPKGGGGSAKAFVIDFDAADTYVPTGIQSVKTPQPQSDVIYDLQGRRVTHPTRGIYIMNGKKMVFN